MIRGFLILIFFPCFLLAQKTFVPDDEFEQVLINLDLDYMLDDSVFTSSIDTVQTLNIQNQGIADLTGIEDFTALTTLYCSDNLLQALDLSHNPNLFDVSCNNNQLTTLSIKNGNPTGLWYFMAINNPNLVCIEVDDVAYAQYNFSIDNTAVFSTDCNPSAISELNVNKRLIKVVDLLGREVATGNKQPLLYIYNDGTVERKMVIATGRRF
tara:strand:- start:41 stop:673 length:633 start_codon:yes stop_codon:yes gene_type:complete